MTGWKTKLAAALVVIHGVLGWLLGLHGFDTAATLVINGLGLVGIGHKIEKVGAAYERRLQDME